MRPAGLVFENPALDSLYQFWKPKLIVNIPFSYIRPLKVLCCIRNFFYFVSEATYG
jgi:hypothetical protein